TIHIEVADGLILGAGSLIQTTNGAGTIDFAVDKAGGGGGTANTVGAGLAAPRGGATFRGGGAQAPFPPPPAPPPPGRRAAGGPTRTRSTPRTRTRPSTSRPARFR